jgi:hypothetical protein
LETLRDHYLTELHLTEEKAISSGALFGQLKGESRIRFGPTDWIDETIGAISSYGLKGNSLGVRVDLALPDKLLVENFYRLLKRERARLRRLGGYEPPTRIPKPSDWIRYGVLPYLDLRAWEIHAGVNIPYHVMAIAVLPRAVGGDETVRKTTSKLAGTLISAEYLAMLAALASDETSA